MSSTAQKFRKVFKYGKSAINWFPGHMFGSFKHMQAKMRFIDCVIEVHDARIPFIGRNPMLVNELMASKPHLLVLNKVDLIDKSNREDIEDKLMEQNYDNVVFTDCKNSKCKGLKSIIPKLISIITGGVTKPPADTYSYKVMVVGIPNVGKSSLINALRNLSLHKRKAALIGATPGITKSVQNEIKINEDPKIYLFDTPGILVPNISNITVGLKLALCSCIKDEIVGVIALADYLLFWMNKTKNFVYVEAFNLQEPCDEIMPVLIKIAVQNNKVLKKKNLINNSIEVVPDVQFAAQLMLNYFRKGQLGDLYLG